MADPIKYIRKHLTKFEFEDLFNELGWDNYDIAWPQVESAGRRFNLAGVAEKRGMVVVHCTPDDELGIPPYAVRKKIESQVTKSAFEHLLIFTDTTKAQQVWQFARREHGQSVKVRELLWHQGQSGEDLIQRLSQLAIDINDEDTLTLQDVVQRAQSQLDVERVTKKFYQLFDKQKNAFIKAIAGIDAKGDQEWYASVMLNRLMFVYFVQKKGFLDGNRDYLRTRMAECQLRLGQNQFHNFYRSFLLVLFHDGLNKRPEEHTKELKDLVGNVPYLNGGIFDIHKIEETYGDAIDIPDQAFEKIFDFFDNYRWHLDDRPIVEGNEINPDVLGYIFEKYINQKQMGAYYTKEDITGHISKNTIIPHLFDRVGKVKGANLSYAFDLLKEDPDRYIYDAIKHGWAVDIHHKDAYGQAVKLDTPNKLPEDIQAGLGRLDDWDLVERRKCWNRPAPKEVALPTEIWREVVERRQRYFTLKDKLASGSVREINELITLNLDIITFAKDAIDRCPDKKTLAEFWKALTGMTVLDPTCGSGAFLFAALEILEPLYDATLSRMDGLLHDLSAEGGTPHSDSHEKRFQEILTEVAKHTNRSYSILKSIVVQNLYGVDIMEEAVEICKLRLFLKLASQIEPQPKRKNFGIEPLPDIDFNIKAGNTLVGFATETEVKAQMPLGDELDLILKNCKEIDRQFTTFTQCQIGTDSSGMRKVKQFLRIKLEDTRKLLDVFMARAYGIDTQSEVRFAAWKSSHLPFHWFCEFFGIMNKGGFDVIIGNPPYVEYSKIKKSYSVHGFATEKCGNLYGLATERSLKILSNFGRFGFIVPISLICTQRMEVVQEAINSSCHKAWFSNYAERPSKLFEGAEVLLTIALAEKNIDSANVDNFVTGFTKWAANARSHLFANTVYSSVKHSPKKYVIPKFSNEIENSLISKISKRGKPLGTTLLRQSNSKIYYRIGGGRYWKIFTSFQPIFKENGVQTKSSRENYLYLDNEVSVGATISVLSSSLFYWFFTLTTNCRDLNPSDLKEFPMDIKGCSTDILNLLHDHSQTLMLEYKSTSELKEKTSSITGELVYQEFYPRKSKDFIDEIDKVLASHYGFSAEELDFIINYDIKYRMGLSNLNGGEA